MATEPSRVLTKLGALLEEEQGRLTLSPASLEKLGAVIEVAARLPDEAQGVAALHDVVRLAVALEDGGHAEAAEGIRSALRLSPAAIERLQAARNRDKASFERFARFTSADRTKTAPKVDARPEGGVSLKDLLPAGVGARLERGAASTAKDPKGPAWAKGRREAPEAERPPESGPRGGRR